MINGFTDVASCFLYLKDEMINSHEIKRELLVCLYESLSHLF